jgi:hypothetical protein
VPSDLTTLERWFLRLALGFTLAVPAMLWTLAAGLSTGHDYTLSVELTSPADGALQVFFDRGAGITEQESAVIPVRRSDGPQAYEVPLPPGQYRLLRIDPPAGGGTFVLSNPRILDRRGAEVATIPLASIAAGAQATTTASAAGLVISTPVGANDPQLVWTPSTLPLSLPRDAASAVRLAGACLGWLVVIVALVVLAGRVLAPLEGPCREWLERAAYNGVRHPRAAIAAAAALSTLLAMYPVILLGKSLVSPNNGGSVLLYDRPPYTPGGHDLLVEDPRGTDTGAGMWAFVPYSHVQRMALLEGELPLWNRFNATGRPLWGQGQSMMLDPLHWPVLLFANPAVGWDVKFVLHRFAFALATGLCVLALTRSWAAGALIAALTPFLGIYLFRLNHPGQFALTYVPWVVSAWSAMSAALAWRGMVRAAVVLAIASALVLFAAPPKEAAVVLLCAHSMGVLMCLWAPESWSLLLRRASVASAAGIVCLLIAAPHWLVFSDTLRASLTNYDVPAARFATWPFALSLAFGALAPGVLLPGASAVVAALSVAALCGGRSVWSRPALASTTIAPAVVTAIAFGAVPADVIARIPLLGNLHQIDHSFLTTASALLPLAAGAGLVALWSSPSPRRWLTAVAACAIALGAIVPASGGAASLAQFVEVWTLLAAGVVAMAGIVVVGVARKRPNPLTITTMAAIGVMAAAPNALHVPGATGRVGAMAIQPRDRVDLDGNGPVVDALQAGEGGPWRSAGVGLTLFPGSQALYELEGISGPDALRLPHYEALLTAAGFEPMWDWAALVRTGDIGRAGPILDMLGVRFLLARPEDAPPGADALAVRDGGRLTAVRRPSAWPRVFFASHVATHASLDQFLAALAAAPGPFASIDATDQHAQSLATALPRLQNQTGSAVAAVTDVALGPNSTRFRANAPGPGVIVLMEAWMPDDFVATLDGRPVPYLRVNHAFKGIVVPASGAWTVEFRYRPVRWRLSLLLAGIGIVLLASVAFAAKGGKPSGKLSGASQPAR